jgi:hypothetical protein
MMLIRLVEYVRFIYIRVESRVKYRFSKILQNPIALPAMLRNDIDYKMDAQINAD